MMRLAAKFARTTLSALKPPTIAVAPPLIRHFTSNSSSTLRPNPVAVEMINYATSLACDQKTEESYAQGLLVLEQCEATQANDDNSKGLVELARSTLLFKRGFHKAAIESLENIKELSSASMAIHVAAREACSAISLRLHEDALAEMYIVSLPYLGSMRQEIIDEGGIEVLKARITAQRGLIELIAGSPTAMHKVETVPVFDQYEGVEFYIGNAALSYGEYLHSKRKFSTAKEFYQKVIHGMSDIKDFCNLNNLGACNMISEEVVIGATCALGQLEAHMGNFSDAEETLTAALKRTEERFGPHHPKVGIILTCIALMYQHKSKAERSSSLLIQEGLFRKAIELLKAPPLDDVPLPGVPGKDIMALARGGFAETIGVQQLRRAEANQLKDWAESVWRNRWMSLGEVLELSESSPRVPIIDTRICRVVESRDRDFPVHGDPAPSAIDRLESLETGSS